MDQNIPKEQRVLIFQGGAALGAYEAGAYKVLFDSISNQTVTAGSIAYLEGPEIRDVDVNEKALQESQNNAISLIEEIFNRNFKAKPSMFCSRCDYAEICKWKKDSHKCHK